MDVLRRLCDDFSGIVASSEGPIAIVSRVSANSASVIARAALFHDWASFEHRYSAVKELPSPPLFAVRLCPSDVGQFLG
jgi:hypothetical protein